MDSPSFASNLYLADMYMDSPSFASNLYLADMVRLHTYIRPLKLAYVDAGP